MRLAIEGMMNQTLCDKAQLFAEQENSTTESLRTAFCSGQAAQHCSMSEATSSGNKARLNVFIPKKMKPQRASSSLNDNSVGRLTDMAGQSTSPTSKPQCQDTREARGSVDSRTHRTSQMACLADGSATNQPFNEVADREWTKEQLRLLHKTLTKNF